MNLPTCQTHTDRKEEMICLSDECPNRFDLRCVQCIMTSKCRQTHNWKMVTEAIQEMFELCQSTEIKEQKKGKQEKPINQENISRISNIQVIIQEFKKRIRELGQRIHDKLDYKSNKLLSRFGNGESSHVAVKNILKTCKKDTETQDLIKRLKEVSNYISCGSNAALGFREEVVEQQGDDTDLITFKTQLEQMVQNLLYVIDDQNEMPSQVQNLTKQYQSQIDKLLEQVKQIPIYQNRIQSLNQKLQIKDAKLKKYQAGGPGSDPKIQQGGLSKKKSLGEESDIEKVKRIQTLIDRRQGIRTSLINYCQKSPQQSVYVYSLKSNQKIGDIQIAVGTQAARILNEYSKNVADQLQFLKYSDSTSLGDDYVQIPLISMKKQKAPSNPNPNQYKWNPNNKPDLSNLLNLFF